MSDAIVALTNWDESNNVIVCECCCGTAHSATTTAPGGMATVRPELGAGAHRAPLCLVGDEDNMKASHPLARVTGTSNVRAQTPMPESHCRTVWLGAVAPSDLHDGGFLRPADADANDGPHSQAVRTEVETAVHLHLGARAARRRTGLARVPRSCESSMTPAGSEYSGTPRMVRPVADVASLNEQRLVGWWRRRRAAGSGAARCWPMRRMPSRLSRRSPACFRRRPVQIEQGSGVDFLHTGQAEQAARAAGGGVAEVRLVDLASEVVARLPRRLPRAPGLVSSAASG